MKSIKNDSLQSLEIFLITEDGPKTYWLKPKELISVPAGYLSDQVKNLHSRRIIRIF